MKPHMHVMKILEPLQTSALVPAPLVLDAHAQVTENTAPVAYVELSRMTDSKSAAAQREM